MMIQAVLGNPHHPEYGVATIPFPIPRDQHAHCMELLEALEIGDAVKADCKVEKIDSFYTVLKRVEMLTVNVEELNYLAHGIVAWAGAGTMGPSLSSLNNGRWLPSAGVGYRFEFKPRVNVRLDYGIGNGSSGFYFQVGEAF